MNTHSLNDAALRALKRPDIQKLAKVRVSLAFRRVSIFLLTAMAFSAKAFARMERKTT